MGHSMEDRDEYFISPRQRPTTISGMPCPLMTTEYRVNMSADKVLCVNDRPRQTLAMSLPHSKNLCNRCL